MSRGRSKSEAVEAKVEAVKSCEGMNKKVKSSRESPYSNPIQTRVLVTIRLPHVRATW